jgi:sugar lactone lactonase YvrE
MSFTTLAHGLYLEALAVDDQTIWFSDVILGGVQGLHADGSTSHWARERMWIGGVILNEDGSVLCSGPGGIEWFNATTGRSGTLLNSIDGVPLVGVNEMCGDRHGNLIFGTLDIASIIKGQQTEPVAMYRLDLNGKVTQLTDNLRFSNGIRLSPDNKKLYHNESFVGTFVYDVAPDGSLGEKKLLLDKPDCDGIALDVNGNVWISGFSSQELLCMTPDGTIQQRLPFSGGAATNVRFGGTGGEYLYITTVPLDAGMGLAVGTLPTERNSILQRTHSPAPGLGHPRTRFKL